MVNLDGDDNSGRATTSPGRPISPSYQGFCWRGRMGVEPTGAGFTDAHTVLKTGEATGPLPPPWVQDPRRAESNTRGGIVAVLPCPAPDLG